LDTTLTLIDLAGSIALLLWGVHMVESGIQRAFGPHLRRFLGRTLGGRLRLFSPGSTSPPSCRAAPQPG
jgi:phosphate:Na+ symporter